MNTINRLVTKLGIFLLVWLLPVCGFSQDTNSKYLKELNIYFLDTLEVQFIKRNLRTDGYYESVEPSNFEVEVLLNKKEFIKNEEYYISIELHELQSSVDTSLIKGLPTNKIWTLKSALFTERYNTTNEIDSIINIKNIVYENSTLGSFFIKRHGFRFIVICGNYKTKPEILYVDQYFSY